MRLSLLKAMDWQIVPFCLASLLRVLKASPVGSAGTPVRVAAP